MEVLKVDLNQNVTELSCAWSSLALSEAQQHIVTRELTGFPEEPQIFALFEELLVTRAQILSSNTLFLLILKLAMQGDYPRRILRTDAFLVDYIASYIERNALDEPIESVLEWLRLDVKLALNAVQEKDSATYVERQKAAVMESLRVFKRRVSLALYAIEVSGDFSVRQTSRGIAALAQACVQVALEYSALFHDDPALVEHVCVFGMGKLGGMELNYSSDIDLIFVCDLELASQHERHQSAVHMMRDMVHMIDDVNAQGYVFRVDLRLRPEGSMGALLPHAPALVNYYLSCGRTWERSAFLKARPVAGNLVLGERVLKELQPFMFKRYLDFTAIDELRKMKELVNANAPGSRVKGQLTQEVTPEPDSQQGSLTSSTARRSLFKKKAHAPKPQKSIHQRLMRARSFNSSSHQTPERRFLKSQEQPEQSPQPESSQPLREEHDVSSSLGVFGWDVKIGMGGIREIEFFVQALQLVHSGTRNALRVKGTLDTLDRLLYTGLIPHEDYTVLSDAYDFYRRLEHRIQMQRDRQDHALPTSSKELAMVAMRMELEPEPFIHALSEHRKGVSEIFSRLFHESEQASEKPTLKHSVNKAFERLILQELSAQESLKVLRDAGFEKPQQVYGQLQMLAEKQHGPFSLHQARSSTRISNPRHLGVYLLQTTLSAPHKEQAFSFLMRLISSVGDRPWFYDMLAENPHATRLLVHVFGSSQLLSSILLRDPNVISRLLGAGNISIDLSIHAMSHMLSESLERAYGPDHRFGIMHRFQQEEFLRLGLHEIGGAATTLSTLRQLGDLAQVILSMVSQEVWLHLRQNLVQRHKHVASDLPETIDELPFCVLALGKFGGLEPGFGSDLDLIFICEPDEHPLLTMETFSKLARRLLRALTTLGAQGGFYDIDTRLRPMGGQGTLVVSYEAFCEYHRDVASLWERQALCRSRPVLGASDLRARLGRFRLETSFIQALPEGTAQQMAQMRERMIEEFRAERQDGFHIKSSRGGLIDLEFLTQYLQMWLLNNRPQLASTLTEGAIVGRSLDQGATSQNTHDALQALAASSEVLRQFEGLPLSQLCQDYVMLRRVELRLQLGSVQREAWIPDDTQDRIELARALGFQGEDAISQLEHLLEQIRGRVSSAFAQVLGPSL